MSEAALLCTNGRVLYLVVKQALRGAGITFTAGNPKAVLVWCDTVKIEYFHKLFPWQVINRIPWAMTMCRKAPFVRLIQRLSPFYPDLFTFLPKSFILPNESIQFNQALQRHDKPYIYKPDKGSLGHGIRMIPAGTDFRYNARLAVAQEYIESFTIDNKKFDLRVYALICSLDPLMIYVYRGGVARFCTDTVDTNSKFSVLTNTAVNCKNPNMIPDKMTRMITDIFAQLSGEGHNVQQVWDEIDQTIVLTILSAYSFLKKEEDLQCPNLGISRCFQIIGCDILLDKNLHPHILEINYRPSMKCNTENSHGLKLDMLKDALKIAAPFQPLQKLLDNNPDFPKDANGYAQFLAQNKSVIQEIETIRKRNEVGNGFEKVYPNPNKPDWEEVLKTVKKLPSETTLDDGLPLSLETPAVLSKSKGQIFRFPQRSFIMKDLSRLRAKARKVRENKDNK